MVSDGLLQKRLASGLLALLDRAERRVSQLRALHLCAARLAAGNALRPACQNEFVLAETAAIILYA